MEVDLPAASAVMSDSTMSSGEYCSCGSVQLQLSQASCCGALISNAYTPWHGGMSRCSAYDGDEAAARSRVEVACPKPAGTAFDCLLEHAQAAPMRSTCQVHVPVLQKKSSAQAHVAVEQPGARVVGDEVQAAGGAAQRADAVGVAPLIPDHVAVPVDAVQVQRVALHAQHGLCLVVIPRSETGPLQCSSSSAAGRVAWPTALKGPR